MPDFVKFILIGAIIVIALFIIVFLCSTALNWAFSTGPWTSLSSRNTQTYWEFLLSMFK